MYLKVCNGDAPVHRDFHTATAVGSLMVIYGGRSSDQAEYQYHVGPDYYSNKVSCYNTAYNWP